MSLNHMDLGNFAMETLDNLREDEDEKGASDDRYRGAAFIVAYENEDGEIDVAFRTTGSDARNNIQMFQRATLIEAQSWARTALAKGRGEDES